MRRAWWMWSAVALVVVADGATSARAADGARIVEVAQASAPTGAGMAALDALPWAERVGLEQAMAAADARYSPRMDETGPRLDASGARFSSRGAHVEVAGHTLTLRATRMGRGELQPLPTATPTIVGPEVQTDRGVGVVEWWRSLPSGLEHGVTIAERPAAGEGEVVIEVALDGLTARALSDDEVEFVDASGSRVATYAHLLVLDADGAHVPARMGVRDGRIAIAVNDEGARYPLVVDPLLVVTDEETLLASGGASGDEFGTSVALSADGSRAIVGAIFDDTTLTNAGSARVFLHTTAGWEEEATLVASVGAAEARFGAAVALTSDGSRALVGAYRDGIGGSARVFLRTGTSWAEEATLLASDGEAGDAFGFAVAMTADGSRALLGVPSDNTPGGDGGSARVFLRTGTGWAEEATLLLATDLPGSEDFGRAVALTSDGTRALVGAPFDDTGSAHVFVRSGTGWAEEATLVPSSLVSDDLFGWSVALTPDESRAVVSALQDDTPSGGGNSGSARVFVRSGMSWTEEATLVPASAGFRHRWGQSVALNLDGSRVLVGSDPSSGSDASSAGFFLRTGTTWAEAGTLRESGGVVGDRFGTSVALSADGSLALVGVSQDDTADGANVGSARVSTVTPGDRAAGAACVTGPSCVSGFCADGVCCDSACGDGESTDCQGCSAALTGGPDGVCAPLSAAVAPTVTCGASVGACDPAEVCSPTDTACPDDVLMPAASECRPSVGVCDVAERCSGMDGECPADVLLSGVECRASAGACDPAELCFGTSPTCPPDQIAPAATVCRASAELSCDPLESCDGVSSSCPADITTCGPSDSGSPDGGTGSDAGEPVAAAGCACRATSRGGAPAYGWIVLGLAVFLRRRGTR